MISCVNRNGLIQLMRWKIIAGTPKGELGHLQESNGPHGTTGTLPVPSPQAEICLQADDSAQKRAGSTVIWQR